MRPLRAGGRCLACPWLSVASKGCSSEGVLLEGVLLEGVLLEGARLEGARLEGARLEGARLEEVLASKRCSPRRGARLEEVLLEGVLGCPNLSDQFAHSEPSRIRCVRSDARSTCRTLPSAYVACAQSSQFSRQRIYPPLVSSVPRNVGMFLPTRSRNNGVTTRRDNRRAGEGRGGRGRARPAGRSLADAAVGCSARDRRVRRP